MTGSRVLRPHQGWTGFDAGVAVVGLAFLALSLWGVVLLVSSAIDTAAFGRECGHGECTHRGVLTSHTTAFTSSTRYKPGYCSITIALDVGATDAVISGYSCPQLVDGSPVDAEIWRGEVVVVTVAGQRIGTPMNPEAAGFAGLLRLVALVPLLLCVAIVHYDLQHHPVVRRVLGR